MTTRIGFTLIFSVTQEIDLKAKLQALLFILHFYYHKSGCEL